jgi:hypothetical protein
MTKKRKREIPIASVWHFKEEGEILVKFNRRGMMKEGEYPDSICLNGCEIHVDRNNDGMVCSVTIQYFPEDEEDIKVEKKEEE